MKELPRLLKSSERTAKRLGLKLEEVSAFNNGTYRVEYKKVDENKMPIGFKTSDTK